MKYFSTLPCIIFALFWTPSFQVDCPDWSQPGENNKHCYDAPIDDILAVPWQYGEHYCTTQEPTQSNGTAYHLASIPDAFTNKLLYEFLRTVDEFFHFWWIGATRQSGNWTWMDGTEWSYTNWAPGQILDDTKCAALNIIDGYWYPTDCDVAYSIVCGWVPK